MVASEALPKGKVILIHHPTDLSNLKGSYGWEKTFEVLGKVLLVTGYVATVSSGAAFCYTVGKDYRKTNSVKATANHIASMLQPFPSNSDILQTISWLKSDNMVGKVAGGQKEDKTVDGGQKEDKVARERNEKKSE
ncbi:hypothetical protein COLO4_18311 [Corchorus olitorius]|uniref:Uncharacterized protein n=1 Tax=Corchorus olitorius TaxID=93759 RepID=A0A1R3J9K6_9ROSI|nr:hypothetical protein COLO4_18311 [Corchorus olitorius]